MRSPALHVEIEKNPQFFPLPILPQGILGPIHSGIPMILGWGGGGGGGDSVHASVTSSWLLKL